MWRLSLNAVNKWKYEKQKPNNTQALVKQDCVHDPYIHSIDS